MSWRRFLRSNPYLFALLLLALLVAVNASLQSNFFSSRAVNGNFRVLLPLMIVAVGQGVVIIGGGIDLSVGAVVSLVNAVLVTLIVPESGVGGVAFAVVVGCAAGLLAGAFNGLCVAYLRLQPIVTTYATSFVFAGLALLILPRPGGQLPRAMTRFYRSTPLDVPLGVYVVVVLLLLWGLVRSSRFGQYLFATGSDADAAYTSGIPVSLVKFTTYAAAGFLSALAALALTLGIGSGKPAHRRRDDARLYRGGGAGRHPPERGTGRDSRGDNRGGDFGHHPQFDFFCQCAHLVPDPRERRHHRAGAGGAGAVEVA